MSVLAQAFLTLVRSHLVSLMLLSVRHNYVILKVFEFANLGHESLGGLESRDVVGGDHDGGVLGDVTRGLLRTGLDGKATEATEIHILALGEGILHAFHEAFNNILHFDSFDASAFCDFVYDFSLCHNFIDILLGSCFRIRVAKIGLFF